MSPWTLELASDVRPSAVEWLWPGYLARGKLALLDGDPEMGKSLLTIDLAARLSRGGPLPDGAPLPRPWTTVLLSAEDAAGDTVRPRLEAAGADLSRVVLPGFHGRVPRFPDDLPALEELVRACSADLVVADPLMAFLPPKVAANLDQCVRQALTPLAALAERTGCAVLPVRHLTKRGSDRAVYRGQGSVGIVAAVRTALLAAARPGEAGGRVLAVVKTNVGTKPPALAYRVAATPAGLPVVEWAGPVDLSADAACRADGPVRMRDRAGDWLRRQLAGGPRKATEISAAAAEAGIPEKTLKRAKADLRVESRRVRVGDGGEWWWYDPDAAWPADAPFKKPGRWELPPIDEL